MKKIICFMLAVFASAFLSAQSLLNLSDHAQKSGMEFAFDPMSGEGVLEKNGHQLSFRAKDEVVLQDYKKLSFTDAPVVENGKMLVTKKFIDDADRFFKTDLTEGGYKIGAILIDPGHGGKDPGALATYKINGKNVTINEKDVNLDVGRMLYSRLKKAYPDKNIMMTRSTDKFLSLAQRTEIANSVKLKEGEAILYISIHVNSSMDKKASGYEVWYLSPGYRRNVLDKNAVEDQSLYTIMNSMMEEEYTAESILIAKFIMDGIQAQVGNQAVQRGIKAEEWFVVRNSNMPSVLVEVGFVSNEKEARNLYSQSYLQKLSLGIYNGLAAFVTHFERSRGFTEAN